MTTEGHHGSNRHIFYAVQMDGGVRGARVLAQQHGLEFIQRVSASPPSPPTRGLSLSTISTNLPGDLFINAAKMLTSVLFFYFLDIGFFSNLMIE